MVPVVLQRGCGKIPLERAIFCGTFSLLHNNFFNDIYELLNYLAHVVWPYAHPDQCQHEKMTCQLQDLPYDPPNCLADN